MRLRTITLVALLATAPAASAARPAGPEVAHATMDYYAVGGTTAAQIRARLDARAPRSPDGYHGDAFTRWRFSWRWPGSAAGRCRASEAAVTLQIDVSFPRWTHPKGASPAVAAAWARYARALARHEQGHVDYARGHYPAVVRAIRGSACSKANAAGDRQLDLIRNHDVAYDAATHHGATQGARFP